MEKLSKVKAENHFTKNYLESISILDNIDWDFSSKSFISEAMAPFDCRKYHWFPATFIPEIPYTLIETLTHTNATVYDPFAGIGTTYFQALLLSRRPYATENCQVAVEFMKSLQTLFDPETDFKSVKETVENELEKFAPNVNYLESIREDSHIKTLFSEMRSWYHPNTLNQLAYLMLLEDSYKNPSVKAAMRISISAILRRASSQSRGWGCIADNVTPKGSEIQEKNAISMFLAKLSGLLSDLSKHLDFVSPEYCQLYKETVQKETIFHADTRKSEDIPDNSVDLIVTSPPYPKMTDYVKSQRLSYYWLGMTLSNKEGSTRDLDREIGARRRRHVPRALQQYFEDLQEVNRMLSKKTKDGGYVCFVMPMFGSANQNDTERQHIVQKVMSDLGNYFIKERELERVIPAIRRTHNIKWSTLEREKIYVFRKGK
jgi:DNA modification methylase